MAESIFPLGIQVETGVQLLARLIHRPDISKLDEVLFPDGLKPNDVVEINGSVSSGKTSMVTHLIKNAILVDRYKQYNIGGLNAGVILIDLDLQFCLGRLVASIKQAIGNLKFPNIQNEDIECIIKKSLENLTIIRCYDSTQLLLTMHSLQGRILSQTNVSLIFIDNVAANYWQDQFCGGIRKMDLYKKKIIEMLQKFIEGFKIGLIYTKPSYFESKNSLANNDITSIKIDLQVTDLGRSFIANISSYHLYCRKYTITSSGLQWMI